MLGSYCTYHILHTSVTKRAGCRPLARSDFECLRHSDQSGVTRGGVFFKFALLANQQVRTIAGKKINILIFWGHYLHLQSYFFFTNFLVSKLQSHDFHALNDQAAIW